MNIGYLITARLKSTRLPKKVMREVAGRPLLGHMIDRLKLAKRTNEIVVCTSTNPQDDPLEEFAAAEGVECFRGSEEDVVLRLSEAASRFGFDYVLNITADCPLADPYYADRIVEAFEKTDADLIRSFGLPHGAFSYGIKPAALKKVVELKNDDHTEVWGRYFTDTDLFSVYDLPIEDADHRWPDLRMTVDYPEDLEFIEAVFAALYDPARVFSLDDTLQFLRAHPEVVEINRKCADPFWRRFSKQAEIHIKPRYEVRRALVFGSGSIGQRHIKNLRTLGVDEIVAIRSRRGHTKELDASLGVTEVGVSEELQPGNDDVAIISNPTSLHIETARKILPYVRGVFLEKPLSNSMNGVAEFLGEVETGRKVVFTGYNLQFHPIVRTVSAALADSGLGKPLSFQGSVGHWLPDWHPYEDWRKAYTAREDLGGGAALTLIHEVRMALGWLGPVQRVAAAFPPSDTLPLDVDVNADLMLCHESGSTTQLHLDFIQRPYHREGVISCVNGWIRYDFVSSSVTCQLRDEAKPRTLWADEDYDANKCYLEMMETFLRFVREGRVRHELDAWHGAQDLTVVCAAFDSEKSGSWITPSSI